MDPRLPVIVIVLALPLGGVARLAPQAGDPAASPPDRELLARAGAYVREVTRVLSTSVMEERYVQVVKRWGLPPKAPDLKHLAWFDKGWLAPELVVLQRQQTRSDMLLVQLPNRAWMAFRDTFEVNGRSRGNREDRLRRLFLEESEDSRRQLRRINQESAAWNLGSFYREINLPTLALQVADPANQPRFKFRVREVRTSGPAACWVVAFTETARPTVVRSLRQRDVPLAGELCMDAAGTIWSTRIDLDGRHTTRGAIEVSFGRYERLGVLAPERMWEWYLLAEPDRQGMPLYLEALATYTNLRQFSVTTRESVK